ncbi:MAG: hypothetical protein AAB425_10790 [Bdellovibrionota bacterium]
MSNSDEKDVTSRAADLMKKVLTIGIGGVFLTEETLRGMISDFKLPKELMGSIFESANRTKTEFFAKLSKEVMERVSDKVDVQALVEEVLAKNEIELSIRVKFHPRGGGGSGSKKG